MARQQASNGAAAAAADHRCRLPLSQIRVRVLGLCYTAAGCRSRRSGYVESWGYITPLHGAAVAD